MSIDEKLENNLNIWRVCNEIKQWVSSNLCENCFVITLPSVNEFYVQVSCKLSGSCKSTSRYDDRVAVAAERGCCSTEPGEAAGHPSLRPAGQPSARLYGGNRHAHRDVEILRCTAWSEVMVNSYLNSYQALAVYISLARTTARYTVCSAASHCPCALSSVRTCRACTLTLTTFCTRLATDSLLETVTLRLFGVDTQTISGSNGDATCRLYLL